MPLLPTIKPDFFKKYPGAVFYILIFTIAGYFTSQYVNTSNERNNDCAREVAELRKDVLDARKELARKDSVLNGVYQQLLISNGIIERLPEKLDSLSHLKNKK